MKYYLGLLVALSLTALSGCRYDSSLNHYLEFIRLFILPGIIFTIFTLLCLWKKIALSQFILFFIMLTFGYCAMFTMAYVTMGLAIPLSAAVGAAMIKGTLTVFLEDEMEKKLTRFILLGLLSTIPGYIILFFSYVQDLDNVYRLCTYSWQLVIGILVIREVQLTNQRKETTNNDLLE